MIHKEPNQNDPADVRRAANRLYCRLKRLGFHLQRGRTVKSEDHLTITKFTDFGSGQLRSIGPKSDEESKNGARYE